MVIMKKVLLLLFLFHAHFFMAQVGINTTNPNAQLDIQSTSQAAPSNTDGILIPKMDVFPAINPTSAQQGMLVYLTTATTFSGNPKPIGFYYWNDSPADWIAVKGTDGGTLDQAYDFGSAGAGRTITADAGAVLINGTDGLVSTGTSSTGAVAPSGAGTRVVWNPRKVAFRAGFVSGSQWDDVNIGFSSSAFGQNCIASGQNSFVTGFSNTASGLSSAAFGQFNVASGGLSTAFGINTISSGNQSIALGRVNQAIGDNSICGGINNFASSFGETVLGIGATIYSPSSNGATQFRTANTTDRLFVIGNAIDANNNNTVDLAERSDAMEVLKNGLTRLPSTTNTMIDAADGKAVVTKEWLQQNTSGTLDQAYDFGGSGFGRTISADAGAVTIDGTDGLVSTGTVGTGVVAPSGAGTRLVWNPRKAAFRAGNVSGTQWDDASIGLGSIAFGNSIASGDNSFAGLGGNASGASSFAFGPGSTAAGQFAFAAGFFCSASGPRAVAFGNSSSASGFSSTAFGDDTIAAGFDSTSFGAFTFANAIYSTAFGFTTRAEGSSSTAFGLLNTAQSFGETTIGIGATNYVPTTNGTSQFRTTNATDRLFVIGNAIDANNNNTVDAAERSDALVILKNGNTGIGNSTPIERLHVAGKSLFTNGFSADNAALIYKNNTDYMFLGPQSGSSANGGAMALFGSTNVSGGNAGGVDFNVPTGQLRISHTNGSYIFRANSTSGYNATFELNDVGLQMGHNSASRAIVFNTASTERMRLTAAGRLGIGTPNPGGKLELSLDEGLKPGTSTWTNVSDRRLKTINGSYTKGLNEILQLNPVRFNYKNNGARTFDKAVLDTEFPGFIAQEVQPLFPDAIGTDDDGFLNFNIHPILIATVNAFKELNAKNNQLENENETLRNAMKQLELKVASILSEIENLKK
jgi:hypothetical protein